MEDALIGALTAERSLLRKEIRHCQTEQKSLSARAEKLEAEVRTLEEAIDDRTSAKYAVQSASGSSLQSKIDKQKEWNTKAQEKISKLTKALHRKQGSHAWMEESRAFMIKELLSMLSALQQDTAMRRSEALSDVQFLTDQLAVKLLHVQYAATADVVVRTRQGNSLSNLLEDTEDKKEYLKDSSDKKLNALLWEREKFTKQFELAKQMNLQKRAPSVNPTGDVRAAHLANCLYIPFATASRSPQPSEPGGDAWRLTVSAARYGHDEREKSDELPVPHDIDGYTALFVADAEALLTESYAVQQSSDTDRRLLPVHPYAAKEGASASESEAVAIAGDQGFGASRSGASTPKYSRGPTPRFGTPKMTPKEIPESAPVTAVVPNPKKLGDAVAKNNSLLHKPRPHKLLNPVCVRPSGRATPPSSIVVGSDSKRNNKAAIGREDNPISPSPDHESVREETAASSGRGHDGCVAGERASTTASSALSLSKALQAAPPQLSRFSFAKSGTTR